MAAQLAQRGLSSGDQVVEHPVGFAATVIGEGIYDLDQMAENLGNPFRIQGALIIKKYPCCGGNHAMLDSLFSLMRQHNFTHEDVASAEMDQSYHSAVMLYQEPEDGLKGKFSAKYKAAAALIDGEIGVETFRDEKIAEPAVQDTMAKVRTRVLVKSEDGSTDFQKGLPIRITLKDGRVFEHTTGRHDILGGQVTPWGFDNIKNKFRENAGMVLDDDAVSAAVDAWSDIPQMPDHAGAIRRTLVRDRD